MSQEWQIRAPDRVCASTGRPFEDGETIYSRLVFTEEGYQRADFSERGWTDAERQRSTSFWKSVFIAPKPPPAEPLKKETAETLLRQFMAKDDYSRKHAIYILAVMLERKRLLVERDVQIRPDGSKVRIYEHRKTNEIFTIPDPGLRLDELHLVEGEVAEMLGIGPRRETPVSPETAPAPDPV